MKSTDMQICSIDSCYRKRCSRGWCQLHYNRWYTNGDTGLAAVGRVVPKCSVKDCLGVHKSKGLCGKHYKRWRIHGDPAVVNLRSRVTHGLSNAPEYDIWSYMISRCTNVKNKSYNDYGGRGITVCDRWRKSFADFYKDMGARPSSTHSIDRIDNNGNYEPGNCRWATRFMQAHNKRLKRSNISGINGVSYCTRDKEWRAYMRFGGKTVLNRYTKVKEEAVILRQAAEKKYLTFKEANDVKHVN